MSSQKSDFIRLVTNVVTVLALIAATWRVSEGLHAIQSELMAIRVRMDRMEERFEATDATRWKYHHMANWAYDFERANPQLTVPNPRNYRD